MYYGIGAVITTVIVLDPRNKPLEMVRRNLEQHQALFGEPLVGGGQEEAGRGEKEERGKHHLFLQGM